MDQIRQKRTTAMSETHTYVPDCMCGYMSTKAVTTLAVSHMTMSFASEPQWQQVFLFGTDEL